MGVRATDAFVSEVEAVLQRMRAEWNLTYAEAIGCLTLIIADIVQEARDDDD